MRVIIIDDERLAREEMKRHLLPYPELEVVGEAENADEAEALIRKEHPDLLFLDIKMPERTGFDLLESLEDVPEIIFTTAFDQYAVKAFEINALDYLVKPIREERFAMAMEKVRAKLAGKSDRIIFVKEGERYHFIKVKDIRLIESEGNYARLYFNDNKALIKRSLNQLEKILTPLLFFRINRNEIVNTAYITQVQSFPNGRLHVSLQTGEVLSISSRQSAAFKNRNIL